MKKFIIFSLLCSLVACSSPPIRVDDASVDDSQDAQESLETEDLPKARSPVPGKSTKTIVEPINDPSPVAKEPVTTSARSCKTPLGTIPHGGQLTGYVKDKIEADEICVSDTVRCNDGVWTGQGIHPKCGRAKPATK